MRKLLAGGSLASAVALLALAGLPGIGSAQAGTMRPDAAAPTFLYHDCGGGIRAITTVPARGFSPLTASAAELAANNYPPRPSRRDRKNYRTWRKYVLSSNATVSTCGQHLRGAERKPVRPGTKSVTFNQSNNWSGYQTATGRYTDVQAQWNLPAVHDSGSRDYYSSSWVGIGDGSSSSDQLIQAGSESDWLGSSGTRYYLWIQIYPYLTDQDIVYFAFGAPNAGDLISAHVAYASSKATFHVVDETTDFNYDVSENLSLSTSADAEWIYERTAQNNKFPYLADAPPSFSIAQAANSSGWHTVGSFSARTDYAMWNCLLTQRLAYASAISGADFHESYENAGDNNACGL
jgi:Peptidase A4 family